MSPLSSSRNLVTVTSLERCSRNFVTEMSPLSVGSFSRNFESTVSKYLVTAMSSMACCRYFDTA